MSHHTYIASPGDLLAGALAVLAVAFPVSSTSASSGGRLDPATVRPATARAQERVFSFVEITAGRLLVSVRRPARLSVFANGRRLHHRRLQRNRVYEIPVHRRGRIRVVAVTGHGRQTVIFHVS